MKTGKIISYLGILFFVIFVIYIFLFIKSWNNGFGYKKGARLGALVNIEDEKYKSKYVQQYADSFFKVYPQYLPTPGDLAKTMTQGYEFIPLTNIYFDKYPRETYCVQWDGISIRFAYNYETSKEIITSATSKIAASITERMRKRLRTEVLDKIDSIISKSKDSVVAILKITF
ncbi:MAG: hypothetical protein ABI402_03450 [Ferruginibacter sp.]